MKKKLLLIAILSLITLLFCFPAISDSFAHADDGTSTELSDEVKNNANSLNWSGIENYLAKLKSEYSIDTVQSVRNLFESIINGSNQLSFQSFIKIITDIIFGELKSVIPIGISIIIIGILFGIIKGISTELGSSGIQKLIYVVCYATILSLISYLITNAIASTYKTINNISSFVDVLFPLLFTVITALGGTTTTVLFQPMLLIFSAFIIKIITVVIFPLFYASLVFGMIGNMSDNINLEKFSSTAKSIANWILGIVFSLFICYVTSQGVTGASIDSLAIRGTKYALSSYVPVVGGYIKDGFDIVIASCVVIKNALGFSAVLILIVTTLYPLIKMLVIVLGLKIVGSILQPICDKKLSDMVFSIAHSLTLLIEVILCLSFSLYIIIMLLIYSCNWGLL